VQKSSAVASAFSWRRFAAGVSGTHPGRDGNGAVPREDSMYIGLGTVVLIVIIVLVVMMLRRG
jgi:hypothetical protein